MEKKPYAAPKIFQVELNQEQAILTACKTGVASLSNHGTHFCNAACKRSTLPAGANNAGAAS